MVESILSVLELAIPPGYGIVREDRAQGRDGGTAVIFKKHLKIVKLDEGKEKGCEFLKV